MSEDVLVMVRPEDVVIHPLPMGEGSREAAGEGHSFDAVVTKAIFEGSIVNYALDADGVLITARKFHHGGLCHQTGKPVRVLIPDGQLHTIENT